MLIEESYAIRLRLNYNCDYNIITYVCLQKKIIKYRRISSFLQTGTRKCHYYKMQRHAGQMSNYYVKSESLHIYLFLFSASDILMCAEYANKRTNKCYECCIQIDIDNGKGPSLSSKTRKHVRHFASTCRILNQGNDRICRCLKSLIVRCDSESYRRKK